MKILLILFLATISSSLGATAQIPDILIYEGQQYFIFTNPLEDYFGAANPRPMDLFQMHCTACWRGYIATFEIRNNELYLNGLIEGTCSDEERRDVDISRIFKDQDGLPIRSSWFSGVIRCPLGEQLAYVHMGYDSVYEKELLLTFEKGNLVGTEIINNKENLEMRLSDFKRTKEYADFEKEALKNGLNMEDIDSVLRNRLIRNRLITNRELGDVETFRSLRLLLERIHSDSRGDSSGD